MAESLEYALGSSTVTGTSTIEKKNIKGKVYLNISVRYQLSDEFKILLDGDLNMESLII